MHSALRNPRYAGAYAYGQNRDRRKPDGTGRSTQRLPREQWYQLQCNAHLGYLSWEEYEENVKRLRENAMSDALPCICTGFTDRAHGGNVTASQPAKTR